MVFGIRSFWKSLSCQIRWCCRARRPEFQEMHWSKRTWRDAWELDHLPYFSTDKDIFRPFSEPFLQSHVRPVLHASRVPYIGKRFTYSRNLSWIEFDGLQSQPIRITFAYQTGVDGFSAVPSHRRRNKCWSSPLFPKLLVNEVRNEADVALSETLHY